MQFVMLMLLYAGATIQSYNFIVAFTFSQKDFCYIFPVKLDGI